MKLARKCNELKKELKTLLRKMQMKLSVLISSACKTLSLKEHSSRYLFVIIKEVKNKALSFI